MSSLSASRSLALLVGFVLVVAGVAPVATSAVSHRQPSSEAGDPVHNPIPPSIAHPDGTTSYLQVPDGDVQRSTMTRVSVDVTASTRIGTDRLELQLAVESFRERFENADNESERTDAVRSIVRTLDRRTEALRDRQQTALEQYNQDEISHKQFLGTLARLDSTAEAIQHAADAVRARDQNTLDYSIPPALETRLRNYNGRLLPVSGLIRKVLLQPVVMGTQSSPPIYIETGNQEVVLATIVGDRYAREGFSNAAYNPDGQRNLSIYLDALNRTRVLYPWTMDSKHLKQSPRTDTLLNSSIFSVHLAHTQGELNIYLDASTTNVFREDQSRDLNDEPLRTVATNSTTRLALTINGTHETGPLRVSLTRPGTDIGVDDAEVFVDGTLVGTTGADGSLWTIDTRGQTEIRVETDAGSVVTARIADLSG